MHIRKSDGRIFYIGIGDKKRPYDKSGRNNHWYNIVNKHDYDVIVLVKDLSWERACELEIKMIAFYGRQDKNLGCLCNLTDGGDGATGHIKSETVRFAISERTKGENNPMYNKSWFDVWVDKYGRDVADQMLDEYKKNMSESLIGKEGVNVFDVWLKKYGEELALKMWNDLSERKINRGEKNGMFGKSNKDIWIEKYGEEVGIQMWENMKPKFGTKGDKHHRYNKTLLDVWTEKYGQEIAKQMWDDMYKNRIQVNGEKSGMSKLKEKDVIWIRNNYKPRDSKLGAKALAKKFKVEVGTINNITRGKTWKHLL